MSRKRSSRGLGTVSPLDGAGQFQEAVEIATTRRQEAEKECRIHYRALLSQCSPLAREEQKWCVQEATEAYREMLSACRMRYEAELHAARVLLNISLGMDGPPVKLSVEE